MTSNSSVLRVSGPAVSGVAVSRGLLLDLVAGADYAQVDEAYRRFVDLYERATGARTS